MNLMEKLRTIIRNDDWIDDFTAEETERLVERPTTFAPEKQSQKSAEAPVEANVESPQNLTKALTSETDQFRQVLDKHFTPAATPEEPKKTPNLPPETKAKQTPPAPDPQHLKVLKKGVIVWNRWRVRNRTIRPNLRKARLQGMNLSFYILDGVDFRGADLQNCNFWHARLNNALLGDANLTGAKLQDTDLRGASLEKATLPQQDQQKAHAGGAMANRVLLPQTVQSHV